MPLKNLVRLWAFALNTAMSLYLAGPDTGSISYEEILTDIEHRIGHSLSALQRKDILLKAQQINEE